VSTSFFDNMFQDARTCAILNLVRVLHQDDDEIRIAFDLPYHGSTTVNSSAFTTCSDSFPLKETAEILADALKTLEIDHVNILGVSHMGLVGCELAGGWPEMASSVLRCG
jgi:pimeloyl-ACP methyl ester carboxylesterase